MLLVIVILLIALATGTTGLLVKRPVLAISGEHLRRNRDGGTRRHLELDGAARGAEAARHELIEGGDRG